MKFKYSTSISPDTEGRFTQRPVLNLELTTTTGKKLYPTGLVDSGADQTMVNIQYAKVLGVDLTKAPIRMMNGAGHIPIKCYVADFPIYCPQLGDKLTVPACYADSPNVDILIGQEGFFDAYIIQFDKKVGIFQIDRKK